MFTLLGGFVALNWTEFMVPSTLSVGFTTVQAPVGLFMLGVVILVISLFTLYVFYLHSAELLRTRRLHKDMEVQKKLVEQSETSRYTELRGFMNEQFALQRQRDAETLAAVKTKSALTSQADRTWMEEVHNGLSAQLGQLEDRLDRLLPPPVNVF
jgi:biopolymer transport protein ExbB/TolQ